MNSEGKVKLRVYALVTNSEGDILVHADGKLPAQEFVPGQSFIENLQTVLSELKINSAEYVLAGLEKEPIAQGMSYLAVAFWVMDTDASPAAPWGWLSTEGAPARLSGFESALVSQCLRSRPGVWVA